MNMKSLLPSLWDDRKKAPEPFGALHREVDRLFDEFSRGFFPTFANGRGPSLAALTPSIDVSETDKAIEVTAELPGVDEKDVEVTLTDDILTIRGEKKTETEDKKKDYHLVERSYGMFRRSMAVPAGIDPDAIKAEFSKGVLKVTLPKTPEAAKNARKIEVKAA